MKQYANVPPCMCASICMVVEQQCSSRTYRTHVLLHNVVLAVDALAFMPRLINHLT
jgi:hypothetical protein